MDAGKRLFTNAMINAGRRPVTMLITLFLVPLMLHYLGKELYGIWSLTGSVVSYTGLLNLGLNSAVDYRIPRLVDKNDLAGVNEVVSSVTALYWIAALTGAAFVAFLVWGFPVWFNIPLDLHTTSRIVVVLIGASVLLNMPLSVYNGVLAGLQRYDVIVGMNLVSRGVSAVAVVGALIAGAGLVGVAAATMATELAVSLCLMVAAYALCKGLEVRARHVSWAAMPGLMAYSVNTLMYGSGQLLVLQSGKTLAGLLYGPAAVTEFAIPFMLLMMVGQAARQAARPMKPAASMLDERNEQEKLRRLFLLTTKYCFIVVIPAVAVFLINGATLLRAWIGPEYIGQGALLLAVMTVPQMLRVVNVSGFFVLSGMGEHRLFGIVILIQAIAGVVLSYLLAKPAGLGLVGIALGISIPELVGSGFIVPRHCAGKLGLRLPDMLRRCLAPALLATLPFIAYCLAVRFWLELETRIEFLAVFGASLLPLALGAWFLGLGRDERTTLRGYVLPARR